MIDVLLLAAAVAFSPSDGRLAHETAGALVKECTPRDAGTVRGRLAANWIMDRVSRTGVDASVVPFRADTPDGEKSFANVIVEFLSERENAPWVVFISHFDTPPKFYPWYPVRCANSRFCPDRIRIRNR